MSKAFEAEETNAPGDYRFVDRSTNGVGELDCYVVRVSRGSDGQRRGF